MSGVEVITFGCRLNTYESEVMRAQAEKAGLKSGDIIVAVNGIAYGGGFEMAVVVTKAVARSLAEGRAPEEAEAWASSHQGERGRP
mgnify:CR=1 FL=1